MMSHHPQRKLSFSVIWRVVQEGGPAVPDPLGTDPAQWREECRVSPPRSAKTSRGPAVRLCAGATSILFRVAPTIVLVRLCTQARRKYTRAVLLGLGNILDRERVWPNFFKSEVKPSPLSRSRGVHAIFTFPPRAG